LSIREFADYLHGVVYERKPDSCDDLLTYLIEAEADG
jgi:cytochrome P450